MAHTIVNAEMAADAVGMPFTITGDRHRECSNVRTIDEADDESLIWISPANSRKQFFAETSSARVIVCDDSISVASMLDCKTFIVVKEPRLAFLRIVQRFFAPAPPIGIHPTAVIHPEARIGKDCYMGAFTYIGRSDIGDDCRIMEHVTIQDNVTIGNRVIIHSGTVIGSDGFGYHRNENGELEKFPHIGGVVIEDDVEIGANTCIDRGVLGNTLIKRGAKIDNLVHIAHNVALGRNAVVVANAMVGGSTTIGDDAWIAPSATLRDVIQIGSGSLVGLAALVTKSIPDNQVWAGSPAKYLRDK